MVSSDVNENSNDNFESGEAEHLRKLFIGGLDYRTTDEGLKTFYEQWGKIVDVIVMKDPKTKRSRGFGFITYSKASMVDEAQSNRPHKIDGKVVEPKRAIPRGVASNVQEANTTVKKIFVAGFKDEITEEDLKKYFGHFGNIVSLTLVKDKETGKSRGFGFIEFDDYDTVDRIIIKGDHILKSKRLDVKKALNKTDLKTQDKKNATNATGPNNNNSNQSNFSGEGNFWNQGPPGPCGPGGPGMGGPGMCPIGYGSNWGMQPAPWQSAPGGMAPVGGMAGPGMNNYMGNQGNYGPGGGMGMGPGPGMGAPGMAAGGMGMGGGYGPGPGMMGGMGMSGGPGMPAGPMAGTGPMGGCAPGMGSSAGPRMNAGIGINNSGSGVGMGNSVPPCIGSNNSSGIGMNPGSGINSGYGMTEGSGMNMGGNNGSIGMNSGPGMGNYGGGGYGMGGSTTSTGSNVRGGSNTDDTWNNNSVWGSSSSFGSNYGQGSGGGPVRGSAVNTRVGPYDTGTRTDGYHRSDGYGSIGGSGMSSYSGSGQSGYSRRY